MSSELYQKIYAIVRMIPRGKVATYGQVADMAGNPRWARVVGQALHHNPDPSYTPCHRVVNARGELSGAFAFGGEREQRRRLETEGVQFIDERVDPACCWQPDEREDI